VGSGCFSFEGHSYEDIQLCGTKTALVATLLLGAAVVVMPFMVEDYTIYVLNLIAQYCEMQEKIERSKDDDFSIGDDA
jgi:hypothetical protein